MKNYIPKWHKELEIFAKIKPLIILEGNVLDSYQYIKSESLEKMNVPNLSQYLQYFFECMGYQCIVFYDNLDGFYNDYNQMKDKKENYIEIFKNLFKDEKDKEDVTELIEAKFNERTLIVPKSIRIALSQNEVSTVIIMNFVSRYISNPRDMEQYDIDRFKLLLQASLEAQEVEEAQEVREAQNTTLNQDSKKRILKNLLVLIVNKVGDIPQWLYLQNPKAKIIKINCPSKEERENLVKSDNFRYFFDENIYSEDDKYYDKHPVELVKIKDRFIALTEGLSFTELDSLRLICENEKFHVSDMCNAVTLYKYGIKENPWTKLDRSKVNEEYFANRVKGQGHAITKTLDVIKRAITGISGLQGSSHNRPKGVLFFAGPTGVGKTETAKTLAEILFGDENCCIRFDMSEYAQSHSDQKLLGAPPGYVGYEAGGQLTNAIKNNPFSVLLFDEIEKAHPSILDKFLQILEDGRMTDGQGNTVYFSESIIIFTSNLGTYTIDKNGQRKENVKNSDEYEKVSKNIKNAIEDYFKITLGRPEILNRIGENIIIFDYIREDVAKEILQAQIDKVINKLKIEKRIEINLSNKATIFLQKHALQNLENGGRGIGNIVESRLINPLARFLFDNEIFTDRKITVKEITINNYDQCELKCSIENVITPTTKNSSLDNDNMKE